MPTGTAVLLHPVVARRTERRPLAQRAGALAGELVIASALVAGGTVAVVLLLLLVVLAAPLAAGAAAWLVWRSGDSPSRRAKRMRARLRRRARALGFVVLAGSQPAVLRLAAASARSSAPPRP